MQANITSNTIADAVPELRVWRSRVLNTALIVVFVAATPVVALTISEATHHPWQWPAALAYVVMYLFVLVLAVFRRLGSPLRAWGLLLLGYGAAVLAFARGGLAGDGRVYLLALPLLAMILIGWRSGLAMAVLSLLVFAVFTVTAHLGWMAEWLVRQDNTLLLMDWVIGGIAFAFALVVLVFLQWRFGQLQAAVAADNARLLKDAQMSQGLYQAISELTSDFAYAARIGPDGRPVREWVAGAFTRITGFTLDEVDARGGWSSLIHPDDLPAVQRRFEGLLAGQQGASEFRIVTKSGEARWLRETTRPVWDEGEGRVIRTYGAIQDITEREQAEGALQESGERLRLVVQSMPAMMDAFDAHWNIIAWNQECERVTGYSAEEIVGNPRAMEMLYPDAAYRERMTAEWIERTDDYRDWEWEIACKDGSVKAVAWSNISRRFPIPGWKTWGVGIDITGRKRAEEALREQEEMARAILDATTESVFLMDDQMRVLAINQTAADRFGRRVEELIGMRLQGLAAQGLVSSDVVESRTAALEEVIRSGKPVRFEDRRGEIVFDTNVYPVFDAQGQVTRLAIFSRDVTALKRAEQQVIRSERLAAMGRLAATLAHEINNPLQAIRSNLELAADFDLAANEHKERLCIVRQEVEHLIETTRRVLDFTRPITDTRYPVSATHLVQRTLALVSKQLQLAHVQATTDIPADMPSVFAVPDQIVQVLLNLTLNAIEAMPDGGHLHIAAHADGDAIVLVFTDDGPPLPAEYTEHIFEPFFTTKPDGSGLGLSISLNIVQQHGGTIDVENLDGDQGVAFTVTLPVIHQVVASEVVK